MGEGEAARVKAVGDEPFEPQVSRKGMSDERHYLSGRTCRGRHVRPVLPRSTLSRSMTFTSEEPVITTSNEVGTTGHLDTAYLDLAAVIGGAIVAVAIFTTLMVFGSAVGLSLTSTDPAQGISAKFAAVAVGLWAVWVAASSFAAGGFVTGRLRHRIAGASVGEVEMRDGLHGLIAWALATLLSAVLLASAIGTPASVATREAANTTQQVQLTRLFRGERLPMDQSVRAEASTLLKTISGHQTLSADDHLLLTQMVVGRTGASPPEAETRVQSAVNAISTAVDQARRASVLAAFLIAVSFAIGAAAAWIAAEIGGRHRDEGTAFSPMTNWGGNWHRFGRKGTTRG